MKKIKFFVFVFMFLFFVSSSLVYAEGKCDDSKIEKLKKQVANVSVVSQYDDEGSNEGIYGRYVVTVYELPKGFYVKDKGGTVLFVYAEVKDGAVSKYASSDISSLNIYAEECSNQALKKFDLDLKKYNVFSNYSECKDIEEGELDVCDKFYDKDITYTQFVRAIEKYKKNKEDENIFTKSNSFVEDNAVVIGIVCGTVLIILIVLVVIGRTKKNKLD